MATKKALITGITGQDGAYLTELLPGYEVTARAPCVSAQHRSHDHLYQDREDNVRLKVLR